MIPNTAEGLPVIGLAYAAASPTPVLAAAAALFGIFFQPRGGTLDAGGVRYLSVGSNARGRQAAAEIFIGNCVDPRAVEALPR